MKNTSIVFLTTPEVRRLLSQRLRDLADNARTFTPAQIDEGLRDCYALQLTLEKVDETPVEEKEVAAKVAPLVNPKIDDEIPF